MLVDGFTSQQQSSPSQGRIWADLASRPSSKAVHLRDGSGRIWLHVPAAKQSISGTDLGGSGFTSPAAMQSISGTDLGGIWLHVPAAKQSISGTDLGGSGFTSQQQSSPSQGRIWADLASRPSSKAVHLRDGSGRIWLHVPAAKAVHLRDGSGRIWLHVPAAKQSISGTDLGGSGFTSQQQSSPSQDGSGRIWLHVPAAKQSISGTDLGGSGFTSQQQSSPSQGRIWADLASRPNSKAVHLRDTQKEVEDPSLRYTSLGNKTLTHF